MSADIIIAAARECVGTPFRHQGRLPGRALDCYGVVVHALKRLGLVPQDRQGYGRRPYSGLLESTIADQSELERLPREAMQAGDILLMRFSAEPQHVAIYTGTTVIHSYAAVRKVVEHRLDDEWRARVVCCFRVKEAV